MQLGARWRAGDDPHRGVPELLHAEIAVSETRNPSGIAWTLTWLEGRPRVQLGDESGRLLDELAVDAAGHVVHGDPVSENGAAGSNEPDDDDDWLM